MYHFLEGISNYNNWEENIDLDSKNRRLVEYKENLFKKKKYIIRMMKSYINSEIV